MLPFALDNYPGPHYFPDHTFVTFDVLVKDKIAAEYALNFGKNAISITVDAQGRSLRTYPDNHGVTAITQAFIYFKHFIPVGAQTPDSIKLITLGLEYVNVLLDCYTLATANYGVRSMSVKDVFTMHVFTYKDSYPIGTRQISAMLPVIFAPQLARSPDITTIEALAAQTSHYMSMDVYYKAAYRSYSQAMRALNAGDLPLAAIQAMVSLEGAIHHYVKARITVNKDAYDKVRIKLATFLKSKKDTPLAFIMSSLFPLLVPDDVRFPQEAVDACNKLRQKRNAAIHEPATFDGRGIEEELEAVDVLLRFLVANHPGTGNTASGRPFPGSSIDDATPDNSDVEP